MSPEEKAVEATALVTVASTQTKVHLDWLSAYHTALIPVQLRRPAGEVIGFGR